MTAPGERSIGNSLVAADVDDVAVLDFSAVDPEALGAVPRLLPGLGRSWPATGTWTPELLARRFSNALVRVHTARSSLLAVQRGAGRRAVADRVVPLARALADMADPPPGCVVALAGQPLAALGPMATADVPVPVLARHLREPTAFLWVGPAGKRVPAHTDGESGLLVQLTGRKRVHLVAPEHGASMAPVPEHRVLSRIADLASDDPALQGVPRLVAGLEPGDALWVPAGWWHQVDYVTAAVSVNFWPASYLGPTGRPTTGASATAR
ncbi:MAG: cupin-like domain-containing protein [Acidimicrobiales bacterium]